MNCLGAGDHRTQASLCSIEKLLKKLFTTTHNGIASTWVLCWLLELASLSPTASITVTSRLHKQISYLSPALSTVIIRWDDHPMRRGCYIGLSLAKNAVLPHIQHLFSKLGGGTTVTQWSSLNDSSRQDKAYHMSCCYRLALSLSCWVLVGAKPTDWSESQSTATHVFYVSSLGGAWQVTLSEWASQLSAWTVMHIMYSNT